MTQPISVEVILIEKKIKSLILKYKDGHYYLSKPPFISEQKAIEWLESLSALQFERLKKAKKIKQSNEFIYLFGKRYQLKIHDMNLKKVMIKDGVVVVYHKKYLDEYLVHLLKQYIITKIEQLHLVDFDVHVDIQHMTSKYGCCFYTQKRVKFTSLLIHEPKEIIDSVIVHELAHFYFPNHQKEFYKLVEHYVPNYCLHQAFLKAGGVGDDPIG